MSSLSVLLLIFGPMTLHVINGLPFNETLESSRIVGGTFIGIGKAKFVVHLREKGKFFCGGTLVSPKFVITAAHCLERLKAADITVVAAATYLYEKGLRSKVAKLFVPKEYNSQTFDMDVAVLELAKHLKGSNISSIDLCHSMGKTNEMITVYGWGQISENVVQSSRQLRSVSVPVIDHTKCSRMYKKEAKLTEKMFCAGDLVGKDACNGDSGGPAIYKNHLCGIVSWGVGCARKEYPGVYTNIMKVRHFIDKAMGKK